MSQPMTAKHKRMISILIPAYNEEAALPLLHERRAGVIDTLEEYAFEILVVNDGSSDGTLEVLRRLREQDPRVCYVNLSRNYGKETAMTCGMDYARGDALIIMDADLQHPPEKIPEMIRYWECGYDDVYAKRMSRKNESKLKAWCAETFYRLLQRSTKVNIYPNVGDFRLLDRRCVNAIRQLRENQRYTKGMYSWIGYHKKEILFEVGDRVAGESKWSFRGLLGLAVEGLTSFSTAPLRLAAWLGGVVSAFAFLYLIIILIKALAVGDPVAGYPSMMCVILFIGGIQLICLGIIGEYLGRVFNESKRRPLYFVDEYNGVKERNEPGEAYSKEPRSL